MKTISTGLHRTQLFTVCIVALVLFAVLAAAQGVHRKTTRPAARKSVPQVQLNPLQQAARLNNLGAAYMGQQKVEQALALFRQAHALAPTLFPAELNIGIALLNLQRLEPAKAALDAATRKQPKSARAWYNLGLLYRSSGEAEKASQEIGRASCRERV